MRIIAACAFALTLTGCLSGCVSSTPPPATDQERSDATDAFLSCLIVADRKLDDNRSDASTIALGLKSFCAAAFARARDVDGRSLNPQAQQMYHQLDEEAFIHIATTVVLGERAKRQH
jgi:hypothetical protein